MKIDVAARRGHERPTCVYCRDEVGPSDALGLCPACGSTFHEPCRGELARCPTPGCVGLDPEAFAARQRAEEEAEREARRAAARARREAEDRQRAKTPAPAYAAVAEDDPEPPRPRRRGTDEVWRADTGERLGVCAFGGAAIGGLVGWLLAVMSPMGFTFDSFVRCVPLSVVVGVLEAVTIGLVGVRREPIVEWGKNRDASCLVTAFLMGSMTLATVVSVGLGLPLGPSTLAGALIGLPLALRFFGLR